MTFSLNDLNSFTQTPGAQASLTFSGDTVSIFGGVSFDHGNYTVTLDGQSQNFTTSGNRQYHAQVRSVSLSLSQPADVDCADASRMWLNQATLNIQLTIIFPLFPQYFANELGPGNHTLTLTASNGFCDLDSVVVQRGVDSTAGTNKFKQTADGSPDATTTPSVSGAPDHNWSMNESQAMDYGTYVLLSS